MFISLKRLPSVRRLGSALAILLAAVMCLSMVSGVATAAPNRPPKLAAIKDVVAPQGHKLRIVPRASDPDSGPRRLRFSTSGRPGWLKLNRRTGVMVGTPPKPAIGKRWSVRLRVTDGKASRARNFTIRVVKNRRPRLGPIGDRTATVDQRFVVRSRASDPDNGPRPLRFSARFRPFNPKWLQLKRKTGRLVGTPPPSAAGKTWRITLWAGDGNKQSPRRTFELRVRNRPPTIQPIDDVTVDEDAAIDPIPVEVSDRDRNRVTVDVTGLPDGLSYDSSAKQISGTPTLSGSSVVTVLATDAKGAQRFRRFTISVSPVNDAPVTSDQSFTVDEGAPNGSFVAQLLAEDEDGDELVFTGGSDVFDLDPDGNLAVADSSALEPGAGPFDVLFEVTDGTETASGTATITVDNVDQAPVIDDAELTVAEDAPLGEVLGTLSANDPDGDTIAFEFTSGNGAGHFDIDPVTGEVSVADGLDFEDTASYSLTVRATAGDKSDTATVTIDVTDVNEAPTLAAIADQSVDEDAAIEPIAVDASDPDGDSLTITLTDAPDGVEYDESTQTIAGTPTVSGSFTIAVTASDGELSATEQFELTVADVNDAPVISGVAPASVEGVQDEALDETLAVDATDEDGDDLTYALSGLPDGLSGADNGDDTVSVTGTPTEVGTFEAELTADDGNGGTDVATVMIVVNEAAGQPCEPISILPCDEVSVDLPHTASFDGSDGGLDDSGFTMVDPPSARDGVDQAPAPADPTLPGVPGFEPELVDVDGGRLTVTATKGIQYRDPSGSNGTNSQLNALGVGVSGDGAGYELETTVSAPMFSGGSNGSQQGGLWFGLDEDNYVKLVVSRLTPTTNKVQLLTEDGATATPGNEHELNSTAFPAGEDVRLVLRVDETGGAAMARAFYSVAGGSLVALVDAANVVDDTELPIPQALLDGAALPDGGGAASFAGVFATKRNASAADSVELAFADFAVREVEGGEGFEPIDVTVNFQSETDDVPDGTLRDFGQPYDVRSDADQGDGAHSYGWVRESSEEPLSLVGNGRDRDRTSGPAATDQRLDTFIHLQYGDIPSGNCTVNVCTDGAWQFKVPNGSYRVTAAIGDQASGTNGYDSQHVLNMENQVLVEEFQGTASEEYLTTTGLVGVADGELTLSAVGGVNTKLNYVRIESLNATAADTRPFVVDVRPGHRSTGAYLDEGIGTDLHLIGTTADPGPVDSSTVNDDTVKLFEVVPGPDVEVAGNPGSTGGGDAVNFQQSGDLEPNTMYRYVIDGVEDELGNAFLPYTSIFTTGDEATGGGGGEFDPVEGVDFEQVDLGKDGKYFTSLVVHDGHLWATTVGQGMYRYAIQTDGSLGAEQAIDAFAGRAAIGLVFDQSDPDVAWVTHATANINNEPEPFGSKVSRVDFSGDVTSPAVDDVFVNLPRSQKDHLSNSLEWGPEGYLYFLQGSNQAAGDPDGAWGNRGETMLSAALLRFDADAVWAQVQATGPIDVKTVDRGGPYDPFATDVPLELYATGIRNAYDLVEHSNGHVYVPTNGTASGGNSPGVDANGGALTRTGQASGDVTGSCATRRIDGAPYTGPGVPAVSNHPTQRDFLFDVEQGGYYGHPNPERCEWVLNNGGNAEGAGSGGSKYADTVQPDRNYRGWAYDFEFNKSPNGVIEYQTNSFGGELQGRMLVVRFSNFDDILTLQPSANGTIRGAQPGSTIGGFTGFDDPLDITEDLDVNPGNLYVNSYDREGGSPKLYLLRVPADQQASNLTADTERLVGNQTVAGGESALGTVTVTNLGAEPAEVADVSVNGPGASAFDATPDESVPATLAPGESMRIDVAFDPASEGVVTARVDVDDADGTGPSIQLRGLGTDGLGGNDEPSLQYVLDAWDLDIETGDDNDATNAIHSDAGQRVSPTLGDSIDAETFERFTNGPVTVEPLSVFGPTTSNPVTEVSWYEAGGPGTAASIFSVDNTPASNGQSLTPDVDGLLQFDPGESEFGLVSRWPAFSDRMVYSEDGLNTFTGAIGNHVRVYPLVENGSVVPHAYVVATEEHVSGFDYQDVVYILRNVDPVDDDPVDPPTGDPIKVNFQSEAATVPNGYLRDFGQAYGVRSGADQGDGLAYGWINADTSDPEPRTTTGRVRGLNGDQRLDTLMHLQYGMIANPNCTANNCADGSWEIAVANGAWQVTAAVGDASVGSDPEAHVLRAEGDTLFSSSFVPSGPAGSATRHSTGSTVVDVTDGKLTIDADGGTNTKLNYLELAPVVDGGDVVDQVNFQPESAPTPAGWVADTGALFSSGAGYGWVRTEGGNDKTADTRARAQDPDPLDGTLVIVDDAEVASVNDGEWEYALADGTYTVTLSVGDPGFADSTHGIDVEGVDVIDGFIPSAAGDYEVASSPVEVTDGRLTVASSGSNTKLQWIRIETGSGVDAIPPTVSLDVTGPLGAGGYLNSATVTADVADTGGSNLEFVDWELDGTPIDRPSGDTLVVDELGAHTVEVTASDGAGNTTTESTGFTVVEGVTASIDIANRDATRQGGEPIPGMHDDFLVMHLLNSNVTTHRFHDTATLRLTNTDPSEDLVVSELTMSAPTGPTAGNVRSNTAIFTTPGTTLPLTIGPGDTYEVEVLFDGSGSKGLYGATMTIVSNAQNDPSLPVQLRGGWQPQPEGGQELTLTQVARAFGFTTDIGEPVEDENDSPLAGDEVRSKQWKRLDTSKPVSVRQLAALHGCCGAEDQFQIPGTGGGSFRHDGAWGQSLLPRVQTGGDAGPGANPAQGTFNPAGNFPIVVAGYSTNTTGNLGVHLWPVEFDGTVVPGAYLVGQDFVQSGCGTGGGANCDYNDNMYLVTNIAPLAPM